MGTKNNVNPDHYKEDGRERPGQDINQEINKQKFTQAQNEQRIERSRSSGALGETNPTDTTARDSGVDTGQAIESAETSSNT